jgi:polar amino acid transport system substrate-binding protein
MLSSPLVTNLWSGGLIVLLVTALAVWLSLRLRERAPKGGYFNDSDRAAGIFSSIGTLFSVLLALVIFLSVETYSRTQSQANAEADSVLEQFQLAELFPSQDQYAIQSQLVCYGRSVKELEWEIMEDFRSSPTVDYWAASIDARIDSVEIVGPRAVASYQLFLAQTLQRQEERRGRLEGAEGALPSMVWPILFLGAAGILAYLIAYADSAERSMAQAFQVGVVTCLLGASLLLINALDHPFTLEPGRILPEKMQASVDVMQSQLSRSIDSQELDATLPCDRDGLPNDPEPTARSFPPGSTMDQIVRRGRLVVGTSYNIALFGELDPVSGKVSGFDNDVAKEIARELGLREDQIDFVDTLIEDRVPALQEKSVDMVIEAMTITPERAQLVEFSRPYYIAGQSLLVRRGNRSVSSLRDLAGRQVCVIAGSTSIPTLTAQAPRATLVFAPGPMDCVTQVRAGAVDAMSTDDIILAGFAADYDDVVLVGGRFTREPYGVAIPKGQTDMVAFVNEVIEHMIADGRWGRIYYEYLSDIPGLPGVAEAKQRLTETE